MRACFDAEASTETTLNDTPIHFMTLCDGVGDGGYMVGWMERNLMRDTKLNEQSIYSESLQ